MKKIVSTLSFLSAVIWGSAQPNLVKDINQSMTPSVALAPLRFLASDELMGRATVRPEIHVAARYISEQFRTFGLKEVSGTTDYFQLFELKFMTPGLQGNLTIGNKTFQFGKDLVQASGTVGTVTGQVVFANFGKAADLENLDVKGKIVVTNMGESDASPATGGFRFRAEKLRLLQEKGAIALVERYRHPVAEWNEIIEGFKHDRMKFPQDDILPAFLVHDPEKQLNGMIQPGTTASINAPGYRVKAIPAKNVMGWIEGTDPKLKDQYIILSAHYDHVGVDNTPRMEEGKLDSIYNGARDNAVGTTAVINAARYFSMNRPKRSILFIAYTGEEMGLLGSQHFAANPTVPLNKVVYNLNIDNASYNDTGRVTVIGFGRTSADEEIKKACATFGLKALADPAPEQNLFDRSDNVSLAAKGVPAPTFSLGIKAFDETITNRYHQLSDEVGNMDLNYVMKYMKSFILAAKYIADNPVQPTWKKGDKYESAWNQLYRKAF